MWNDNVKVLRITKDNFAELSKECPDFSIFLVNTGILTFQTETGEYNVYYDSLFFSHYLLNPKAVSVTDDAEIYVAIWTKTFALTAFQGTKMVNQLFFAKRYISPVLPLSASESEKVQNYMLNFNRSLCYKEHLYYHQMVSTTFTGFFSLVFHYYNVSDKKNDVFCESALTRYAEKFIDLLEKDTYPNISLEYYSNHLGVSKAYLHRVFKSVFRQSFIQILDYYRFYSIRQQLLYTNKDLDEIAEEAGFSSTSSLIRYFNKFVGITPNKFRRLKAYAVY